MPSSACKKKALRSEVHTSELQSHDNLVCRLLLEKKKIAPSATDKAVALEAAPPSPPRWRRRTPPPPFSHAPRSAIVPPPSVSYQFFFNDTATTEIYPLSLHDALPI